MRRTIVLSALLGAGFLLTAMSGVFRSTAAKPQPPDKPNIVFIYTDDQTYNTIRALGNKQIITPNMDFLANNGTSFTHAYNMGGWHGAICVASRTMIITGMSVWQARDHVKSLDSLSSQGLLWGQQMKKAGYDTYMTGKWHVAVDANKVFDHTAHIRPGMPNDDPQSYNRPQSVTDTVWQPWDTSRGGFWKGGKHWSEVVADDAIGYIGQAAKNDNPFFMYLAFNAPHDPRQSPKEYVDMYPVDKIRVPENFLPEYPYKDEIGCSEKLRDEALAPFPRTRYSVQKHIQEYYALITHLDVQIGKILDALRSSGKIENTYIFFTADHGLAVGQHGLLGKQNLFDHSVRPPLIVYGPDVPKAAKRDQQVYLQDIMATTLDLAGLQKPSTVFFNSLMPVIRDKKSEGSYAEIYGCYMDLQRMVRTDRYKLIVYPEAKKLLLFDLKKDPREMKDLSDNPKFQKVLDDMKRRLQQQQRQMGDHLDLSTLLGVSA